MRVLVEMLEPYEGRVYDPCCGSGGMFVQSAQFIEHHRSEIENGDQLVFETRGHRLCSDCICP